MDTFFSDTVKAVLLGILAVGFGLNRLARAFPDTEWLQWFRLPTPEISEEERQRRRRRANRSAAVELGLAGLALPLAYFIPTIMLFNEPKPLAMAIVGACSLGCIALAVWLFVKNL